jgi:hypothetical protein
VCLGAVSQEHEDDGVAIADQWDALVLPGGFAPNYYRRSAKMLTLTTAMAAAAKPIAAICHGPWMLCSARRADGTPLYTGHQVTAFSAIKDDVINAGATWMDQPVVVAVSKWLGELLLPGGSATNPLTSLLPPPFGTPAFRLMHAPPEVPRHAGQSDASPLHLMCEESLNALNARPTSAGYKAPKLKKAGFDAFSLRAAGFDARKLKATGFKVAALQTAGFTASELAAAHFKATQLRAAGFDARSLRDAGFGAAELRIAGADAAEMEAAGYSIELLVIAGFSPRQLLAAGLTGDAINATFNRALGTAKDWTLPQNARSSLPSASRRTLKLYYANDPSAGYRR